VQEILKFVKVSNSAPYWHAFLVRINRLKNELRQNGKKKSDSLNARSNYKSQQQQQQQKEEEKDTK